MIHTFTDGTHEPMNVKKSLIVLAVMFCSCSGGGDYLKSLGLSVEEVTPTTVVNLEDYEIFKPRHLAALDGLFYVSRTDGDHHIAVIDPHSSRQVNVLKRGRGPGEVFQGASLHRSGNSVVFNDCGNGICLGIRCDSSFRTCSVDTIARFSSSGARPYFMCRAGDCFVSGNVLDPGCWYALYDKSGKIRSCVEPISFPELKNAPRDRIASMMLSSIYASNSNGSRVCVANVVSASMSFATVTDGILEEYERVRGVAPEIQGGGVSSESKSCFNAIAATDKYVYVLYSGLAINDEFPCDECSHLIQYTWEGTPVKHYHLSHSLSAICLSDGEMYALSSFPEPLIMHVPVEVESPEML